LSAAGNSPMLVLLAWVIGGVLALFGALTYSKLGARRPDADGFYEFIRDGFGRGPAFFGLALPDGLEGPSAYDDTLKFLASRQGFVGRNPDTFRLLGEFSDIAKAKQERRVAVIMGLQNSEHFRSLEDVKRFHQLGQRCSQRTYKSQNLMCSGCTDRVDGGVSDYGAQIIAEMNTIGMLIDVSHCDHRKTFDAISLSSKPIAISLN
jgi:microsomal dipeptidase-like Zn-dependent dipeptidase